MAEASDAAVLTWGQVAATEPTTPATATVALGLVVAANGGSGPWPVVGSLGAREDKLGGAVGLLGHNRWVIARLPLRGEGNSGRAWGGIGLS